MAIQRRLPLRLSFLSIQSPREENSKNQHSPTSPNFPTADTYLAPVPWAANVLSLPDAFAVVEFAAVDVVLVVLAVAAVAADAVAAQGRALEAKVHSLEWWRSRRFLYCPSPSFQLAATFPEKKNTAKC